MIVMGLVGTQAEAEGSDAAGVAEDEAGGGAEEGAVGGTEDGAGAAEGAAGADPAHPASAADNIIIAQVELGSFSWVFSLTF